MWHGGGWFMYTWREEDNLGKPDAQFSLLSDSHTIPARPFAESDKMPKQRLIIWRSLHHGGGIRRPSRFVDRRFSPSFPEGK